MKYLLLLWLQYGVFLFCVGQKPMIDFTACNQWEKVSLGGTDVTNDGKFVKYYVESDLYKYVAVLQRTDGKDKRDFLQGKISFTNDGKRAIILSKDSLFIKTLSTGQEQCIPTVRSFSLPTSDKKEWLAYLSATPEKQLVVMDLASTARYTFSSVIDYVFTNDGKSLVIKRLVQDGGGIHQVIHWINTANGQAAFISGREGQIVLADKGKQLVLKTTDKSECNTIWYYQPGMDSVRKILDDTAEIIKRMDVDMTINDVRFCNGGKSLFLTFREKVIAEQSDVVKVNVWSYKNRLLPTVQSSASYSAIMNLEDFRFSWLAQEGQRAISVARDSKWLVLGDVTDGAKKEVPYLISTVDRKIQQLPGFVWQGFNVDNISPDGKFLVYYDISCQCWMSYNTTSLIAVNISKALELNWSKEGADAVVPVPNVVMAWVKADDGILIADEYDIWWMDLTGNRYPVNITNGFGRSNHIVFGLGTDEYKERMLPSLDGSLLLHGFNLKTKESGFYTQMLNKRSDPALLSKGNNMDALVNRSDLGFRGAMPQKALGADLYIIKRSERNSSVNIYSTQDFKSFTRLSDIYPERKYNWFTTELHHWRAYDGKMADGILYKPENFDSSKKYPVIFCYYEKRSSALNTYIEPSAFVADVNIPWLVSHGYLVFVPDIHYEIGHTGLSAYNYVVSAADYISALSYVDTTRLGLDGHSMGGYETNSIITRTNKFAAAVSTCGMSDLVSCFGSLWGAGSTGASRQGITETGQTRMGCTPWERPDLYIENSPVFFADRVSSPVLLMGNRKDGNVAFEQAVEFFTALRRLHKYSWMLEYEGGSHGVFGKSSEDYTLRVMQFFDHYLKGVSAPRWMTEDVKVMYRTGKYHYYMGLSEVDQ